MIGIFLSLVDRLTRAGAFMAAIAVVAMLGHILLEVVLRSVFNTSTYVLDEFVGYGVAASTFLGLGYTLQNGGLIRVNLVLARLHNRAIRQMVELVCIGACFSVFALIWVNFWNSIVRNFNRGTVSETVAEVPMWIPEGLLLLGLTIFLLQLLAYAIRVVQGRPMLGEYATTASAE